jgi:hypothetical protein
MESSETTRCLSVRKRVNRTDLAYAAGILDGEGSISVSYSSGCPYPCVRVTNTNRELIEWFHQKFGGSIYDKKLVGFGHKAQWDWDPTTPNMKWFLKLMIPFLKVKQRQARLVLVLRSMIERKSTKTRKIRIAEGIRTLNN